MHLCTQRVNKTPLSEHKSDKIAIACDNIVFNLSHPSDVIMDAAVEGKKKKKNAFTEFKVDGVS